MILIGCDFSINKPAATVFFNNQYLFYGWPYNLPKRLNPVYDTGAVNLIERTDVKEKGKDTSEQMRYQVTNAAYLSDLIVDSLKQYLGKDTYFAFEGISYGSSGDVILQLGGYKYMIMEKLRNYMPMENIFTYAPTTVKKTANCSKRGLGKNAVIESFINNAHNNTLKSAINDDKESFMKKGMKNYIDHLDDLIDSYWVLQTLRDKEIFK